MAKGKVTPRDMRPENRKIPSKPTRCYEDHPSVGKDVGRGTVQIKGKLGG